MSAFGQRGRQFFNKNNNNNDDTKKRAGTTKWSDVRTQCLVQKYGLFPSLVPTSDNIMKSLNGDNCEWLRRPGYAASFLGQDLKEFCDSFDNMTNLINNEYVAGVLQPLRTLIIESDVAKIIQPIGNSVTQFQESEIEDDEEEVATAMYTFTTELCNWAMLRPDGHADSAGMIKEMEALLECITPLANLCVDILIYLSILDHGSDYILKGDAQLANNEYFTELKKGTGDVTTMSQYSQSLRVNRALSVVLRLVISHKYLQEVIVKRKMSR
ncbi:hypothetical protein Pmar_PMAR025162 [Perkinsus marinus ATCC 50983]|uniref:Uncharacterized protein n=1 Tax=Perkinsus marinus (strain ATCC 50983 / TXsc) TaxID=423536 RepID=C5L672_PERM5|nr:hypothetical protein Pmar_PMAR025162 [Perkinsus marinus ATCC 50983]EER07771.1 hypothetical protein Pmar_PMAR025162 [Perkinsus marinus ATCC 50983]|eukprot:XP_002775955.1 hypothetical protein Pmar_PMAR025162 [Perkinsus marinus ATCC 50983]